MKKMLIILLCLISFNARSENLCVGERAEKIQFIEYKFQSCLLDFSQGNDSNVFMINITHDKIKCLQDVADDIFNAFYSSNKEEKHSQFSKFIEVVQEQSYNLEIGSDLGKHWHTSTFYELGYINHTYVLVHNMVRDYINYMKQECEEIPDEAIKEMNDK